MFSSIGTRVILVDGAASIVDPYQVVGCCHDIEKPIYRPFWGSISIHYLVIRTNVLCYVAPSDMYGKQAKVLSGEAIIHLNRYEFENFTRAYRKMDLNIWRVLHTFQPLKHNVIFSSNSNIYYLVRMITCLILECYVDIERQYSSIWTWTIWVSTIYREQAAFTHKRPVM